MKIDPRALAVVALFGVGLVIGGVVVGQPPSGIEGAYFNRSVGAPAYAGVFAAKQTGLLSASDGNLWLGAGIAVLLVTASALLVSRVRAEAPLP